MIGFSLVVYFFSLIHNIIGLYIKWHKCKKNAESQACQDQKWDGDIGMDLAKITTVMTRLVSITQVYEWMLMKHIILWQKSKDLTEALL